MNIDDHLRKLLADVGGQFGTFVVIDMLALGFNVEQILAHFFAFDHFALLPEGAQMDLVPDRLRGEQARFDIVDKSGNVIVGRDKRINAKHIRDLEKAGLKRISVPDDYVLGRVLAHAVVDGETGEIVAKANEEITEELLTKLRDAKIREIKTLYTNDLDHGPYMSSTLRIDETPDQISARVAIYRMMRPGEPPTEDAVQMLFDRLFFNTDSYDLSAVGRMKFNRRLALVS